MRPDKELEDQQACSTTKKGGESVPPFHAQLPVGTPRKSYTMSSRKLLLNTLYTMSSGIDIVPSTKHE